MTALVIENCRLFEPRQGIYLDDQHLLIEDGRIATVSDKPLPSQAAERIDANGRVVLPGLIDAHFHAYGADFDVRKLDSMPMSLLAQYARHALEGALKRGFTTVRDAAGADIGLKLAIDRGLIAGPRLFFSGRAISQTGGHGDPRAADHFEGCACGYSGVLSQVADGPDAVRLLAREQLRRGATQLKLFLSGGVISPTDPIWMPQMSAEEIRAAVDEAASRRTYVMAHAQSTRGPGTTRRRLASAGNEGRIGAAPGTLERRRFEIAAVVTASSHRMSCSAQVGSWRTKVQWFDRVLIGGIRRRCSPKGVSHESARVPDLSPADVHARATACSGSGSCAIPGRRSDQRPLLA